MSDKETITHPDALDLAERKRIACAYTEFMEYPSSVNLSLLQNLLIYYRGSRKRRIRELGAEIDPVKNPRKRDG